MIIMLYAVLPVKRLRRVNEVQGCILRQFLSAHPHFCGADQLIGQSMRDSATIFDGALNRSFHS